MTTNNFTTVQILDGFFCICDLSISESSKQSAAGSNRQFFASDQPPAVEASIQHPFEPLPPIFVDVF